MIQDKAHLIKEQSAHIVSGGGGKREEANSLVLFAGGGCATRFYDQNSLNVYDSISKHFHDRTFSGLIGRFDFFCMLVLWLFE